MDYLIIALLFILFMLVGLLFFKRIAGKREDGSIQLDFIKKERDDLAIQLARVEQKVISLQEEKKNMLTLLKQDNDQLKSDLAKERDEHIQVQKKLEKTNSYFNAQTEKINEQKEEIKSIKEQLNKDFELIANRILQEKTERFTESNHKNLFQILNPLKENLKTFEEKVDKVYNEETKDRNSLKGAVELLIEQ